MAGKDGTLTPQMEGTLRPLFEQMMEMMTENNQNLMRQFDQLDQALNRGKLCHSSGAKSFDREVFDNIPMEVNQHLFNSTESSLKQCKSSQSIQFQFNTEVVNDNSEVEVKVDALEIDEVENSCSITMDNTNICAREVFDKMSEPIRKGMSVFSAHKLFVEMSGARKVENSLPDVVVDVNGVESHLGQLKSDLNYGKKEIEQQEGKAKEEIDIGGEHKACSFTNGGVKCVTGWLPNKDLLGGNAFHSLEAMSVVFDRGKNQDDGEDCNLDKTQPIAAMVLESIDKLEATNKVFDPGKMTLDNSCASHDYEDGMLILPLILTPLILRDKYAAKGRFIAYPTLRARLFEGGSSRVYVKGSSMEGVYQVRDVQLHGDGIYHTTGYMKGYAKMASRVKVHKVFDPGGYSQGPKKLLVIRLHTFKSHLL